MCVCVCGVVFWRSLARVIVELGLVALHGQLVLLHGQLVVVVVRVHGLVVGGHVRGVDRVVAVRVVRVNAGRGRLARFELLLLLLGLLELLGSLGLAFVPKSS